MKHSSLVRLFGRLLIIAPFGGLLALAACGSSGADVTDCPSSAPAGACCPWEVVQNGPSTLPAAGAFHTACDPYCAGDGTHATAFGCTNKPGTSDVVVCTCDSTGRRPAGLVAGPSAPCSSEIGAYFAGMARLEAASVDAFRALHAELHLHHAPRALRRAAASAARDEIRHARTTARLAGRFGAAPQPVTITPPIARTLEQVAEENAVEGCVRETFGALVASFQATSSRDPAVRSAMARIARDEARHAALAWRVARWADGHLGPDARRRVAEARRAAAQKLLESQGEPDRELARLAGVPTAATARRMAEGMIATLWNPALHAAGA
ncbi:MAG: ferritin-like domain-containing protein [Byssovorax sp.]